MFSESFQPDTGRSSLRGATFSVVDVETTGVDPAVDRVVEVACVVVKRGRRVDAFSTFVHPGRTIPATASAIHHITQRHTRDAPTLAAVAPRIAAMCNDAVVVAHNASFDLRFLPFLSGRPVLCTMRLARHVIPDAPSYKNQVLRYHLGIDDGGSLDATAHRAIGDVRVTSRILEICIERFLAQGGPDDLDAFLRRIAAPRRLSQIPFGLYRGMPITSIPTGYLQWLRAQHPAPDRDVRLTVEGELRRRGFATHSELERRRAALAVRGDPPVIGNACADHVRGAECEALAALALGD